MRLARIGFILLAIYIVFLGGSAYYGLVFQVRVLHHLLITGLLGLWLINRIRRGQGLPQTPLNWPLLGAVVVWIISAVFSIDPRMAFENLWFPLTHVLFFLFIADLFQRGREQLVMETQFLLAAMVVMLSGMELASWYFGLGIIPGTNIGWVDVIGPGALLPIVPIRLALAMNISTLLAGYVAPLVTIAAVWALTSKRRDFRVVLMGLAGSLLVILILTFSRGGLLSILSAAGIVIVFRLVQTPQFTQRAWLRVAAGGAVAVGILGISAYMILSITQARAGNTGDEGRLDMWQSAVEMLRDNVITGVGPGLFGRAFRTYRDPSIIQDKLVSAHNAYLNDAAETGLPGVIVGLWLAVAFVRAWVRNWRAAASPMQKRRLEAALAALVGMGVHSLVDVFTITPIVLLSIVLAAYCVIPRNILTKTTSTPKPAKNRYALALTGAALLVVAVYGVWFFRLDQALGNYLQSFGDPKLATARALDAAAIDPALDLYTLQVAYIYGRYWPLDEAITKYEQALELEPTWETGWINLAALRLRQENQQAALAALSQARQINSYSSANQQWATLAEETGAASDEAIINAYISAIRSNPFLPLSDFWWATELRRSALERYLPTQSLDTQYRILAVYDPEHAYALVPDDPQTAPEWWVMGEYALSVEKDNNKAEQAFSQAIQLARTIGDYYASRARATLQTDPTAAERDLKLAQLLGTIAEYPNAIRVELATSPEEAEKLRTDALPSISVLQEFAGALYARPGDFDVLPEMGRVGPGRTAMQPWYTIAEERLAAGNTDGAMNAYRAILAYAPDETEARDKLAQLQSQ